ncbi:hypothetical protein Leryth_012426 [Lithospermum erythrorhizon]|nr:hypothetical protein Leryth_012426 [Lithospermum erythrorhizon]
MHDYTKFKSGRKFSNAPSLPGFSLHSSSEYCWLTQEDIVRFLLNSIGVFSPLPTYTIKSLNIITRDIMTIHYNDPASLALSCIQRAITEQASVAVIDDNRRLIGEISPNSLAYLDETVAAAIMTLSAGDLMAYTDYGGPPEDLVQLVKMRLEDKGLTTMLQLVDELTVSSISSSSSFSSCSSDDDAFSGLSGRNSICSGHYSSVIRSEAIMCFPWSSLIAVMVQALAHRVSHVWVVDKEQTLVGLVTFQSILEVLRGVVDGQSKKCEENSFKQ